MRKAIPPLVYRLQRCESKDIDVLNYFFKRYAESTNTSNDEGPFYSELLYYLIVFSELWERPQPSMAEMTRRLTEFGISAGANPMPLLYCAFSKEKSKECNKLKLGNYDADGIIYKRDKYWNVSATIPSQPSVLLLRSKLDTQTPQSMRNTFSDHLTLDQENPMGETCGMKILGSYVKSKGDLASLDKSCLDEMLGFNMTLQIDHQNAYFGTDDAYDGIINSSSGSS
ncbi:hypothetical protein Pcac1_g16418 [Phytophthora cactorum]|nr:hypothetical protein Pcac1_g16418 [Phytophthora cactorum]KAG2796591.1 hypothetical protein PC111_g21661 [Phytophthora cactorum]KAG2797599.1 hypothetical protein PC112_g21706 [Phytophthora cactorum]KAG3016463.1 hypothetical protein PC120_g11606 [Phytophthora cactorum]